MILTTLFKNVFKRKHKFKAPDKQEQQRQQQKERGVNLVPSSTILSSTMSSLSSPTSPTSSTSMTNKKVIDGRVYHDREDVTYIMPEDDEDKDRLHQQHWMIRLAFGSNFDAPVEKELEKGIVVLDSACGPATWTLEMAQQFPHSTFHGIDIAQQYPDQVKPSNCHFQAANITQRLPFPDNYFDYIHQRLLVVALTREGWNNCLSELFRVLKPGGWIELKEVDVEVAAKVGPPTMVYLMQIFANLVKSRGMVPGIGAELPELLKTYKFQDVRVRTVGIAALDGTKLGELAWEDFVTAFEALKPILPKMYPDKFGSKEQLDSYIETAKQECLDKVDPHPGLWYSICAQKPL